MTARSKNSTAFEIASPTKQSPLHSSNRCRTRAYARRSRKAHNPTVSVPSALTMASIALPVLLEIERPGELAHCGRRTRVNERCELDKMAAVRGCDFRHHFAAGIPLRVIPITRRGARLARHELPPLQRLEDGHGDGPAHVDARGDLFLGPLPLRALPQQQQRLQLRHRIDAFGEKLQNAGGNV